MSLGHWTSSRYLLVLTALAALSACGGESKSDDDDGDSSDGSGGSSAGGTDNTGGSSGVGGSSVGGSSVGGSNAGGSNAGGTSNTGGTGAGGETTTVTTTTTSTGGSGGTNPVPPPALVDGCEETCDVEVAAGCASGPTASSCADGCNLLTRVPACAERLASFFDCISDDDTTSCSNEDEVVFDGCVSEQVEAYACVLQEAPDPELEEPCENYCTAAVDAMCENDEGDLAGCILWCQSLGTTFPSCQTPWQGLLECGETADFECDANGEAQPVGCDVEALFFLACICDSDPTVCE